MRYDNRLDNELRQVKITRNYIKHAEGSCLIEMGDTKVICTATVEESVPPHKKNSGEGWVTAEYNMLPRATSTRNQRDISRLKLNGRTQEIQRLIGRSLRCVVDFKLLGERQIIIDCDVIQADGGTRTASITGGFVAMYDAARSLINKGLLTKMPITNFVAAISGGIVEGNVLLDLAYIEDSNCDVDMNVVMTDSGRFIELQGTGEKASFDEEQLKRILEYCKKGISELINIQKQVLEVRE